MRRHRTYRNNVKAMQIARMHRCIDASLAPLQPEKENTPMLQHPCVTDIINKRVAYEQAKEAFLRTLLTNPKIYALSEEALESFLTSTVQDEALCADIRGAVAERRGQAPQESSVEQ